MIKESYQQTSPTRKPLHLIWDDKEALQLEMFRLLLKTLSVNWAHNATLIDKIEKLSFRLAGYSDDETRIVG